MKKAGDGNSREDYYGLLLLLQKECVERDLSFFDEMIAFMSRRLLELNPARRDVEMLLTQVAATVRPKKRRSRPYTLTPERRAAKSVKMKAIWARKRQERLRGAGSSVPSAADAVASNNGHQDPRTIPP